VPVRILFLNRWPQYGESRRWDNKLARFDQLAPGAEITWLVDDSGRSGAPDGADVQLVPDFTDTEAVLGQVDEIVRAREPFDQVIAFSEYLLELAAAIRARHGIPGPEPAGIERFRDKRIMKSVLGRAGVRVPRWAECVSPQQVRGEAERLGYPLILKPARGAGSQGVHAVATAAQLERIIGDVELGDHEIEEFVTGDILHADGVVDRDGKCLFLSISRYVSTCLDFEQGRPLGSVLQTDPAVRERCEPFARECLAALDLTGSAFHLEFFDTGTDLVFLEIGARVPGADVAQVIQDVHGVNLFQLWVDVQLDTPVSLPVTTFSESGGWLIVPRPRPLPRRVVSATSMLGRVPHLYRELVPRPGEILRDQPGSYATLQAARFLFRGGSDPQITEAVALTQAGYRLESDVCRLD
jgi:hypothetical protein